MNQEIFESAKPVILTEEQMCTLLAALRFFQDQMENGDDMTWMPHFQDGIDPLTIEQINSLCEMINCQKLALLPSDSLTVSTRLLRYCLLAFNEIPNKQLGCGMQTYSLASAIDAVFREHNERSTMT